MSRRPPSAGSPPLGRPPAGTTGFFDGAAAHEATMRLATDEASPRLPARQPQGRSIDPEGSLAPSPRGAEEQPRALVARLQQWLSSPRELLDAMTPALARAPQRRRWLRRYLMRSRSEVVDPYGLDPVVVERWRPLFELLYRHWWRVESSGMEHLPDFGRALIVCNHGGTLPYDSMMLMYAIRYDHPAHRTARPLIEDVVYQVPFLGVLLNRLGCVRASQPNAERLLADDTLVAVFPEGGKGTSKLYKDRYRLQRFGRGGFVKLALRTGTPIIPAALLGPEDAHPLLGRLGLGAKSPLPYLPITATFPWLGPLGLVPRRERWLFAFGAPMDLSDYGPEREHDSLLVTQLNDQVRSTIQEMLDSLVDRRSQGAAVAPPPGEGKGR